MLMHYTVKQTIIAVITEQSHQVRRNASTVYHIKQSTLTDSVITWTNECSTILLHCLNVNCICLTQNMKLGYPTSWKCIKSVNRTKDFVETNTKTLTTIYSVATRKIQLAKFHKSAFNVVLKTRKPTNCGTRAANVLDKLSSRQTDCECTDYFVPLTTNVCTTW